MSLSLLTCSRTTEGFLMSHRRPIGSKRQILAFTNPVNCSILHRCYYSSLPWILDFLLSPISSHHCHFWTFSYFVLIPVSLSFLHSDHPQLMFRRSDTFCLAISFLRLDHPPCFDFQLLSANSDISFLQSDHPPCLDFQLS